MFEYHYMKLATKKTSYLQVMDFEFVPPPWLSDL